MASLQFPLLWKAASPPPLFPLLRKAASPPLALYDGVTPAHPEPSSHDASFVALVSTITPPFYRTNITLSNQYDSFIILLHSACLVPSL